MSGWSKVMGTVLGIVIGGFSVAALAYVLGETTISGPRQALPDANLSQELRLWTQTNIASHTSGLGMGRIFSEQGLGLMESRTRANDRGQLFSFDSPQSVLFLVEHKVAFDSYHVKALFNSGMMRNEIASFQTGFHIFNQQRPLNSALLDLSTPTFQYPSCTKNSISC